MKIVQISDTHGKHSQLKDIPQGDLLVHCGDFSHYGTEDEVLDFLNWLINLPFDHKIFVVGNHDLCLWDADGIEDLPENVHFLQDRDVTIDGVRFFGLGYNHNVRLIPKRVDVLLTHEPPLHVLDKSSGICWGNIDIRMAVEEIKPRYHLFGHSHESHGMLEDGKITYSNGSLMDDKGDLVYQPILIEL